MHAAETLCSLQFAVRARQVRLNRAQASIDGWSHKYKMMLEQQSTAFNAKEKSYLTDLKQLKSSSKSKDLKLEQFQIQVRQFQDRLIECDKRYERCETERLRLVTQLKGSEFGGLGGVGGSSSKDRKNEFDEDRKWNQLQSEVHSAQMKATDMKQQLDKCQNDWKDKYASLEQKLKDQVERMRVQRIEWMSQKKVPTIVQDEEDATIEQSPEVTALTRQVALLELEVKRLKLTRNASLKASSLSAAAAANANGMIKSPRKFGLTATAASATSSQPTTIEEADSNEGAISPRSGTAVKAATATGATKSTATRNSSSIPAFGSSSSGSSALAAAKQAALTAQRRAQEAQGRTVGAAESSSRSNSAKAKRASLLPPPKTASSLSKSTVSASSSVPSVSPSASSSRIGRLSGSSLVSPAASPALNSMQPNESNDTEQLTTLDDEEQAAQPAPSSDTDADDDVSVKRGGSVAIPVTLKSGRGHAKTNSNGSSSGGATVSSSSKVVAPLKRTTIPVPSKVARTNLKGTTATTAKSPAPSPPPTTPFTTTGAFPTTQTNTNTDNETSATATTTTTTRSMLRQPTTLAFTSAPTKK